MPPRLCHSPAPSLPCRSQGDGAGAGGFPGKESLAEFLGWLDFLDELVLGAHPVRIAGLIGLGKNSETVLCPMPPSSEPRHPRGRGCHHLPGQPHSSVPPPFL